LKCFFLKLKRFFLDNVLLLELLIPLGVTTVSILLIIKSRPIARMQAGKAPANIILLLTVCTPENTKYPNPPAPIKAAIVISPTAVTAAILIPDIITGIANGN